MVQIDVDMWNFLESLRDRIRNLMQEKQYKASQYPNILAAFQKIEEALGLLRNAGNKDWPVEYSMQISVTNQKEAAVAVGTAREKHTLLFTDFSLVKHRLSGNIEFKLSPKADKEVIAILLKSRR